MSVLDEFLESRNLAEATYRSYNSHLKKYEKFIGKSLDELIEEAEAEEDAGIRLRKRKIKDYLTDYRKYLEDLDRSPKHIRLSIAIVRIFYNEFDIQLPKMREKHKIDQHAENIKNLPDREDIQKAVNHANLGYKGIIFLMVSSGMGSSEIRNLKYTDFLDAVKGNLEGRGLIDPLDITELISRLQGKDIVPEWVVRRQKTKNFYYTFSSPESSIAILTYLENQPPQSTDDYLFRDNKGSQISGPAFNMSFNRLNDSCKFGKTGRLIHFRSHNLRKIFTSTLYAAGLPQLTIDWLLGHKIDPVTESYFKADTSKLRLEYLKVVDNLTFIEKIKLEPVTSLEYDRLLQKNLEMEERMEGMESIIREMARELKKDKKN